MPVTRMARALKVPPLVNDARLARMAPSQIVQLVRSDRIIAVQFVKELASRPNPGAASPPVEDNPEVRDQ